MATRDYWLQFGSGDPRTYSGLSPTFLFFVTGSGATVAPPSIAETYVGTGLYKFSYDAISTIAFLASGVTTSLSSNDRFVTGVLDPLQNVLPYFQGLTNQFLGISTQVGALGTSQLAIGNTLLSINTNILGVSSIVSGINLKLGSTASSFGNTSLNPGDVFGFVKRIQEILEGDQVYTKASGLLQYFNLGSTTLLRQKTITDDSVDTTRT